MTQHISIEALLQQFNQLELTSEAQLEQLLEKLESKKTELPVEDHSIIDWGIGFIRAKIHEEERIRKKMCRELDLKYESYSKFLHKCGWERINLVLEDQEKWFSESFSNLYEIVKDTEKSGFLSKAEDYAKKLREYVSIFLTKQDLPSLAPIVINRYADHCRQRANDLKQSDRDIARQIQTIKSKQDNLNPQDQAQLNHLKSLKAFSESERQCNAEYWESLEKGLH
jgi:hypothetical protein